MKKNKKKVCFIDFDMTVKGGAESVVFELAEAFCDLYDVCVAGIKSSGSTPAYSFSRSVRYVTFSARETRFRKVLTEVFWRMGRFIRQNKFDIVFMAGSAAAFITSPHVFFCPGTKFVFCDHGALINEWDDKEIRMMRKIASKVSWRTVVLTERTRNDYKKLFSISDKKICHIPNWISDRFRKDASAYDLSSKRILSVGRFGKEKGYDMLVDVAKYVFAENPDWKWDIYGAGETFEEIESRISAEQLQDKIVLHGSVKETTKLYAGHALFVLPSYREGLPLVLLEAKVNHLPCVSFDVLTGPREIITDRLNGFLIKPYNIRDMADKINLLIADDEIRREFSEQSCVGMEKYDKQSILKKWVALIEKA